MKTKMKIAVVLMIALGVAGVSNKSFGQVFRGSISFPTPVGFAHISVNTGAPRYYQQRRVVPNYGYRQSAYNGYRDERYRSDEGYQRPVAQCATSANYNNNGGYNSGYNSYNNGSNYNNGNTESYNNSNGGTYNNGYNSYNNSNGNSYNEGNNGYGNGTRQ